MSADIEEIRKGPEPESAPGECFLRSCDSESPIGRGLSVSISTVGCQHNFSDGEQLWDILYRAGFTVLGRSSGEERFSESESDDNVSCVVLNGCVAKTPSHDRYFRRCVSLLCRTSAPFPAVVVAGCTAQTLEDDLPVLAARIRTHIAENHIVGMDPAALVATVGAVGVDHIAEAPQVILSAVHARNSLTAKTDPSQRQLEAMRLVSRSCAGTAPPPIVMPIPGAQVVSRENPLIAIVPICTGCLHRCAYCRTVAARGRLRSFPISDVVSLACAYAAQGAKEIRLVGEDVGAYGLDIGSDIATLAESVGDALRDRGYSAMLRLGMANPPHVLRCASRLGKLLGSHPNIHSYLHLPIQSGSDAVLRLMRRGYTTADFEACVAAVRKEAPHTTIVTDIICGFPGETEEDHLETLALLRRMKLPYVNVNAMFLRQGTPAADDPKLRKLCLSSQVIKRRCKETALLVAEENATLKELVGSETTVWVCERAHDGKSWAGHTKEYVQVLLPEEAFKMPEKGKEGDKGFVNTRKARIVDAGKWSVRGEVIG